MEDDFTSPKLLRKTYAEKMTKLGFTFKRAGIVHHRREGHGKKVNGWAITFGIRGGLVQIEPKKGLVAKLTGLQDPRVCVKANLKIAHSLWGSTSNLTQRRSVASC
ncbi:hypothetical protein PoB_007493100 [Plakobranchus ocellatus]|uniref:Uncharacterized protein n=1 Tax=Plakobranchus ocellatus TaxID=259542 RepID=A0AAV4DWD2_9GAST|nr:hypothetical protein PoB_007493100 [Plakobranchus ocellatus]